MNFTRFIGWLTFFGGVAIILFTLYTSYNVFMGEAELPEIFDFQVEKTLTEQETFPVGEDIGKMILEPLKKLLPVDALPRILNLLVWSILAGILIFGGAQIANLGVKLIKIEERKE